MNEDNILIERKATYITISNTSLEPDITDKLKKSLSVWDGICHQYTSTIYLEDEDNDTLIIPGGYSVERLKYYYPDCIYEDNRLDFDDWNSIDRSLKVNPRDSIQVDSCRFLGMSKYSQKFLSLQTGLGKTYTAINRVIKSNKLPIIFVDVKVLANNWINKIQEYTDITKDEIYLISGSDSIERLKKRTSKELNKIKCYVAIYRTLDTIFEKENGRQELIEFFKMIRVGIKIFDEAHTFYKSIFRMDSCTNVETIYLSASPTREDKSEKKVYDNMFSNVGKHYHGMPFRYINTYMYYFDSNCPDSIQANMINKRGFDVNEYSKYLQSRDEFINETIFDVFRLNYNRTYKATKMVFMFKFIDEVYHKASIMEKYLKENNIDLTVGTLTGKTKAKEKDIQLSKNIIFTTDSSFNKGVDLEGLELLINYVPVSGESRLNQIMGRLRYIPDKNVFFIQMYDYSVNVLGSICHNNATFFKQICKKIRRCKRVGFKENEKTKK